MGIINKENVYEEFFAAVNDSRTCIYVEGAEYSSYIDGLCDMTKRLLDKLSEKECKNYK